MHDLVVTDDHAVGVERCNPGRVVGENVLFDQSAMCKEQIQRPAAVNNAVPDKSVMQ